MKNLHSRLTLFLCFILTVWLSSCASVPKEFPINEQRAYTAEKSGEIFSRYSPFFIIENFKEPFNLIGTVKARLNKKGEEELYVDPEKAAIYVQKRTFETDKGSYTNLIYRVHFERVPFSLVPFYLVKGDNVGIFVIVTLNEKGEPILFTTLHTCGCYLAFIPTSYMPADDFPEKWDKKEQWVYGYTLPGFLQYPETFRDEIRPTILIRSGTHRMKNVQLGETDELSKTYDIFDTQLKEMEELDTILLTAPLNEGETTSFFETSGSRKGYVKGSHKPLERLLMSWWAFDWRIGEDKKLGIDKDDGPLFYTSLKTWARKKSDMRSFASFLKHWGWDL